MKSLELKKRIITSIFLLSLLFVMFSYSYILIISSIIIGLISWIEFYALISKIVKKNDSKSQILRFLYKSISLLYLSGLVFFIIFAKLINSNLYLIFSYSLLIAILSDIGGLVVGKIVKGKKLNKISPNKTISGSLGSFMFSLFLIPFFLEHFYDYNILTIILFTIIISFASQLGDLLISLLKRKAKVKNTSDLLPGHGGVLDRIDSIIFAIPVGLLIFSI
jgi:phosphatidate cytidylyltransferase